MIPIGLYLSHRWLYYVLVIQKTIFQNPVLVAHNLRSKIGCSLDIYIYIQYIVCRHLSKNSQEEGF